MSNEEPDPAPAHVDPEAFAYLEGKVAHDLETRLRQQLDLLHRRYHAEAKPIIDQLVRLESLKPQKFLLADLARGMVVTRHNADGTVERIAPEDFYAKPGEGGQ